MDNNSRKINLEPSAELRDEIDAELAEATLRAKKNHFSASIAAMNFTESERYDKGDADGNK